MVRLAHTHIVVRSILACIALVGLAAPPAADAHGAAGRLYRTTILGVEPADLPIEVRMSGDEIRFENVGDGTLELCGYEPDECIPWVRIGPEGVFEDRNSKAWAVNRDSEYGPVPEGAGEGPPEFVRVRRAPATYTYHDHRVHWMGGKTLPPNVDERDPAAQKVYDGVVRFRYEGVEGAVTARLEYVGGRTLLQQYGELGIMLAAVLVMVGFFLLDARRRRHRRHRRHASNMG